MNKTTYLILFILTSLVCSSALSQTTISFDDQGFTGCQIIDDNHSFSANGKTFNIYAANFDGSTSTNGSLWFETASGGCWHYFSTEFEDGGYITAGYTSDTGQQWYAPEALVVKTTDGSDFKFTSFKAHDAEWNSWGNYLKIFGYKNGVLQGSESVVIVSDVEPYHSTVILTDPVFGSIDEVRITMDKENNPQFNNSGIPHSSAEGLYHSFDTFVIDNAVSSATAPTVTTSAASSITATGATLSGNVTADGGDPVTARGFVYSSSDNTPNLGEGGVTDVPDGDGTGVFSEAVSGLSASTTYYYQAYANNSAGTSYGEVEIFTTSAPNAAPIVDANTGLTVIEGTTGTIDSGKLHFNDDETEDDTQLTATITTALAHGTLFLDANLNNTFDAGDEQLTVSATFTQDDVNNYLLRYTNTADNQTSDSFVFTVSDPDGGELTNQTFNITINQVPTVTVNNGLTLNEGTTELIDSGKLNASDAETGGGTDITFTITSAVSHGILFIDSNPSTVFEAGDVELVENATFTLDDVNNDRLRYTNNVADQASDSFEFKVSDPDGGELTNQTFNITINLLEAPTVTTTAALNVTATTATLGGEVTDNGGAAITERGVVYNTTGAPNVDDDIKVTIGSGDGVFSDEITGLTAGTTYYVRAYAINSEGTSYGSEESFITSTLGLEDDYLKNAVSLYPNPVNDVLHLTNTIEIGRVVLFNVLGKRIDTIKMENNAINVSSLESGIYLLKIETERGNVIKRIIKE